MKFAARRHICAIKMHLQTQSEILLAKCNRRCDGIVLPGPGQRPINCTYSHISLHQDQDKVIQIPAINNQIHYTQLSSNHPENEHHADTGQEKTMQIHKNLIRELKKLYLNSK